MKQLLLLLIITAATLTANAQARLYDAFNLKARSTIQLGNKTITEITDDTVMANKYQAKLMSEWATKKAIENALQGIGVDTNVLATRLRLYKVKDSLNAIINGKLSITDTSNKWVSKTHTINNISNGTGFLKNNGSGTWSWDGNSYVDLASTQTITGIKTIDNGFTIRDNTAVSMSTDARALKLINDKPTGYLLDTISTAPYILFSSKSYVSDFGSYNPPYSSVSSTMQWRLRQSLNPAGQYAGQDNRLYFDYKNGDAGSWISAVSISKDGVQGNITGIDQMTLGNYSGNMGKITFKNIGGYTAGHIEAGGNVLRIGSGSGKIEFFNGVVNFGGAATTTGSQLSANGWALTKTANTTFTASALLHLAANKSTAGNASLKFTLASAALLSTQEIGAFEAVYDRLYFTDSTNTRNTLAYISDVAAKQDTITGAATTITTSNLTANRALISDGSGKVAVSSVTDTELGYVGGVTSNIQTQLNAKLTTANSNVKRYIRVDSTTYSGNYAMDGTKEVVLIDYADPCSVTLPEVSELPTGAVYEVQWYNWAVTNKTISINVEGSNSEAIDVGHGISSAMSSLSFKSYNQTGNNLTPLSLRIMWLAEDNVWTVLQGGVFDY